MRGYRVPNDIFLYKMQINRRLLVRSYSDLEPTKVKNKERVLKSSRSIILGCVLRIPYVSGVNGQI